MKKTRTHCFLELLKIRFWHFWPPSPQNVIFDQKRHFSPPGGKTKKKLLWIHMSIIYIKILYDMKFWFTTFLWRPKMGGRYLKTPYLTTRGPETKKRRVHCFLDLLKIKRWTRKKNWFLTFLTPPPKRHFLTEKRHFWPIRGQIWKKWGLIHMSILYKKILYDMGFWFATFFRSTLWPPEPIFRHFVGPKKF